MGNMCNKKAAINMTFEAGSEQRECILDKY